MIQGIVFVRFGCITEVHMRDDNDDVYVIDMDVLTYGMCPVCNEGLKDRICPECRINWDVEPESSDVARKLLTESADEQFLEGVE